MSNQTFHKCFIGILIVISLLSCSSKPAQPTWVDQPYQAISQKQFLVAVGYAAEKQIATDRALANLAKNFSVTISEKIQDDSSVTLDSSTGSIPQNRQEITRRLSTSVDEMLEGAQIKEYWGSNTGQIYALAVLDKSAARARLRQKINELDKATANFVNYARTQASNPISALQALNKAHLNQLTRSKENQNLMIINQGQGVRTSLDTNAIEVLIRDALSSLPVQIVSKDANLKAEMERALASLGVTIKSESQFKLKGEMDTSPPTQQQRWYWLRGSYQIQFQQDDHVLAKQRWPIKVSATDPDMLEQRLRDQINQELPHQVYDMLSTSSQQSE